MECLPDAFMEEDDHCPELTPRSTSDDEEDDICYPDFMSDNSPADEEFVNALLQLNNENPEEYIIESSDDFTNHGSLPTVGQITIPIENFKPFSNDKSNKYFWQNHICDKTLNLCHGGIRGMSWRTMFKSEIYGTRNIASESDARLLFNMSDHMMNNSTDQRHTFFEIS